MTRLLHVYVKTSAYFQAAGGPGYQEEEPEPQYRFHGTAMDRIKQVSPPIQGSKLRKEITFPLEMLQKFFTFPLQFQSSQPKTSAF